MASKRDKRQRQSSTKHLQQFTGQNQESQETSTRAHTPPPMTFKYPYRPANIDPVDWKQYGRGKFINHNGEWQVA